MQNLLEGLTPAQYEAVTHLDGPLLVVAGAGSGKTRVVTRRIAHLISKGVWPNQILALTFTNKAAKEMKERVADLVGELPRWVGTFHSACARFLRRDLEKLRDGRTGEFTIYDTSEQAAVIKWCLTELKLEEPDGPRQFRPADLQARISYTKCGMVSPAQFEVRSEDDRITAMVYAAYEKRMREVNALDFDDLLLLTVRLLTELAHLRDIYHSRFRYVLVDEYQDTNHIQYQLTRLLTGPQRNVHVTGDPDQSIYSWRGADYENILRFEHDFENARVVRLEQNYRSTKTILHVANEVIRYNESRIDKELFTDNPEGEKVTVVELSDERVEAEWVVQRMAELRRDGASLREVAVFYRTNAQSRTFEEALLRHSMPYQIVGGTRFYDRKEIKDLLAHLKVLINPRDMVSLQRVVSCSAAGVGPKTLSGIVEVANSRHEPVFDLLKRQDFRDLYQGRVSAKLGAFAQWCRQLGEISHTPVADCVHNVLEHSGMMAYYESRKSTDASALDRLENLGAFVNRAVEFQQLNSEGDLRAFLEEVSLVADVDAWDSHAECLSLMTLHSSKGLEFPYVFIVGAEDGLLPHQNSSNTQKQVEEERRLFYVGLTRAERQVFVTHATFRNTWGGADFRRPSPFLSELPEEALELLCLSEGGADW